MLLLRVMGVPARYVTGFRGGDWNSVGGYVAVRDDRAHAWAEAFLPDAGWVRVDATPAGPAPVGPGRVAQVMDALDYFWNRWVVGYDLGRQLELARRAGRHLGPSAPRGPSLATVLLAIGGVAAVVGHRRDGAAAAAAPRPGDAQRPSGAGGQDAGRRPRSVPSIACTARRSDGSRARAGRASRTRRRANTRSACAPPAWSRATASIC